MAKNDVLLLDGIIDDRISSRTPSDDRGEAFEFFAFEQILKDYDLSPKDIASGSVNVRIVQGTVITMLAITEYFWVVYGRSHLVKSTPI